MNSSTDRRRAGSAYDSILLASTSPSRLGDTVVPSPRLVAVPLGEAPATGPTAEEEGASDDAPGALPPRPPVPPPRERGGAGAGTGERIPESGGGAGMDAGTGRERGESDRGGLMRPLLALGICLGVIFLIGRFPPEMLRTAAGGPAEPVRMAAPLSTAGADAGAAPPANGGVPTTAPGAGPGDGRPGRDDGAVGPRPGPGQPTGSAGTRGTAAGFGDGRGNTPGRSKPATSPARVPRTGAQASAGRGDPPEARGRVDEPNRSAPRPGGAAEEPGQGVPPVSPTRPAMPNQGEAERRSGSCTWTVRTWTVRDAVAVRGSADGRRRVGAGVAASPATAATGPGAEGPPHRFSPRPVHTRPVRTAVPARNTPAPDRTAPARLGPERLTPAEPSPPPPTRGAPSARRP